jgi:hypothetical protein
MQPNLMELLAKLEMDMQAFIGKSDQLRDDRESLAESVSLAAVALQQVQDDIAAIEDALKQLQELHSLSAVNWQKLACRLIAIYNVVGPFIPNNPMPQIPVPAFCANL